MYVRINNERSSYIARIMRGAKMYQKSFSVKKYGSLKKAEKLAKKWIVEQKKILPPKAMNEKRRMTSRNRSGIVGVSLVKQKIKKENGKEYEHWYWVAKWPGCKFKGGLRWKIGKNLSYDDAFVLAVISREEELSDRNKAKEKLRSIYGQPYHLETLNRNKLRF